MLLDLALRLNSLRLLGEGEEEEPSIPAFTVDCVIAGDPVEDETLTVTPGTVTGYPVPTRSYQWQADDGGGWDDIVGETDTTLVLTSAEVGSDIRCIETATNTEGSDTSTSNELGPVEAASVPAPTVAAVGTPTSGIGDLTVTWPTHSTGQIAILMVETANQAVANPDSGKWTELASSPQSGGTAGASAGVRLTVFGADVVATESNVTITDPGDHAVAAIIVIDGSTDVATFITQHTGQITTSASNPYTTGTVTTTVDNSLILHLIGPRSDTTTPQISNVSNPDTATVNIDLNHQASDGNGGGLAVLSWVKETAGLISATSFDQGFTNITTPRITYAIRPA